MNGQTTQKNDSIHVPVIHRISSEKIGTIQEILGSALLLDKPSGWTSYDCIRRIKRYFPKSTKIGHAGTLDPMATGLLILLFGKATKSQQTFLTLTKQYDGAMRLGQTTASMDSETEIISTQSIDHLTSQQIHTAFAHQTGAVEQIPPMYSAVKVKGERLYKKARRGEVVTRQPNTITIYSNEILNINGGDVHFRVECSKGTYIRVFAHDIGQHLHVGAHLIELRRTSIGEYDVEQALTMQQMIHVLEKI
ncbi:MAG: tRNA pseudouridine(55) synthase TruB [Bacteroidetes bacterium]|nr:tRNA pseudouridine(55) synthase TruB [Bacteroidota bacterium]